MSFIRKIDVKREIKKRDFDNEYSCISGKPHYIPKGKVSYKGVLFTTFIYNNQDVLWKLYSEYVNKKVKRICKIGLYHTHNTFLKNTDTQEDYCLIMLDVFDLLNEICKSRNEVIEKTLKNNYQHLDYVKQIKKGFKSIYDEIDDYYQKDFIQEIKECDYSKDRRLGFWIDKETTLRGKDYKYKSLVLKTQDTLYSILKQKESDYDKNEFICKSCLIGLLVNKDCFYKSSKGITLKHSFYILTILKNIERFVNVKKLMFKWIDFIDEEKIYEKYR